ncbi:MAG: 2-octaprenyl-3-methyl-6-methoxy-1,4-benzoquinol hydroxylase [SAR86 cluster bacterium]|uniref:2-octaprenyl-3-methyl-6-methoxy-1,4-benzoquinol hydroxylase n=1 Tax=SAR86 cluster bacterium TaxID=2030880 RepID=A0A2A4MSE7_9GAMM|nr:MAG: 2-octaprenyl-3-methyl-6-methoxy-1,4-benzoquinol hydroxylase [SAR86 cluster bacterium]
MIDSSALDSSTPAEISNFDILIVGGGMVGASLACLLGESDLSIGLIDSRVFDGSNIACQQTPLKFDARVSAITAASKQLFENIGVWQSITALRCSPYEHMKVWDADGTGAIHFSAADLQQEELGHIVENSVILASLYKRLESLPDVQIISPASIESLQRLSHGQDDFSTQGMVELKSHDQRQFRAKLVVAADGANSNIRQLANFATKQWDYDHQAIVTTVRTEHPHKGTALQRFMESGPLAFLPLSVKSVNTEAGEGVDQHYCSIVWSCIPAMAERLLALDDAQFSEELAQHIEHHLGAVQWLGPRFSFPLRQRHSLDYVQENIVLVGDAAHTIHPLAGQGVNLGLLDVTALSEEIMAAVNKGRDFSELRVLQRYQRRRKGHNLGMMWAMEAFKRVFAESSLPVRWLRNTGMSSIDNMPMLKNTLARRAMGLD